MSTCPNCGYEADAEEFDGGGEMGWECEQCGEHNVPVDDVCSSCGASVSDWMVL